MFTLSKCYFIDIMYTLSRHRLNGSLIKRTIDRETCKGKEIYLSRRFT